MKLEFLEFLVPQLDWMQVFFFLLIFGTTLTIVWKVKRSATPQNWEKNWHNGKEIDKSSDLDAEHGSVHDICQAVATKPEKWAEIMPGILLVIGLLGTFLGLGIALNKASLILMDASVSGMDDAMSNLMAMMQGLGTKFKTSTWGIIAFLGLKFWTSYNGFDEHRLRWTAQKMKRELDNSRIQLIRREHQAQRESVTSISELGDKVCVTLEKEADNTRNIITLAIEIFKNELIIGRELLRKDFVNQQNVLQCNQEIMNEHKAIARESADQSSMIQQTLKYFATTNASNIDLVRADLSSLNKDLISTIQKELSDQRSIMESSQEVLNAQKIIASQVLEQESLIRQALKLFATENASNIGSVRTGICDLGKELSGTMQKELSDQRNIMKSSQEILSAHKNISHQALQHGTSMRNSLESFVSANTGNIESMQRSSEKMAVSADKMGQSAEGLGIVINSFETNVSEVMNVLKQDLKSTIDNMNESFESNMSNISTNLVDATNNISQAVGMLSINVEKTMDEVERSIRKSLETQQRTQAVFGETSETLNTNVEGLTQLINQLCDDIKSGLSAVSESGRRMVSLDSRYKNITENAESVAEKINTISSQILEAVTRLQSPAVHVDFDPMLRFLQDIKDEINNQDVNIGEKIASMQTALSATQFNQIEELSNQILLEVSKLHSPALFDPLLTSLENIRKSVENQELKLGSQITALQPGLPTGQFDQVVGLLSEISRTLEKSDKATVSSVVK